MPLFSDTSSAVSDPSYRITSEVESVEETESSLGIACKRIALVGRMGGMNRREARNLIASYGAVVVSVSAAELDWVVVGADEPPLAETELLSRAVLDKAASGDLNIISEDDFWQRLGLVDFDSAAIQLYTPAMLADLLGVSVRVIRRWHRRGLIHATETLYRLPYFEFQEVATARRLASWIASGASPQAIEQRLVELVEVLPGIQRPLDQLSILVEGKEVLLRQGEGLLDLGGQMRFNFLVDEPPETEVADSLASNDREHVVSFADAVQNRRTPEAPTGDVRSDKLLQSVYDAEDADDLETAIDCCHAILARDGPRPDISFQLGELLYRCGQIVAARERYYAAIETSPEFVEARASLANVLAELGQTELAIAAFRGAISLHPEYVEAHFGLAKLLDQTGRHEDAARFWQRIVDLSPDSSWAQEAQSRLGD